MKGSKVLILNLLLTIVSFFGVIISSFAWFTSITSRDAFVNTIFAAELESMISSVKFYMVDKWEHNTLHFDQNNSYTGDSMELKDFNTLGNGYQVLIELELTESFDNVIINATTTSTSYIGTNENELRPTGNKMSNIISFHFFTSLSEEEADGTTYYTINPDPTTHELLQDTTYFVNNTFDGLNQSLELYNANTSGAITKAFIVLDYYDESINYIFSKNITNSTLANLDDTPVSFDVCDFTIGVTQ